MHKELETQFYLNNQNFQSSLSLSHSWDPYSNLSLEELQCVLSKRKSLLSLREKQLSDDIKYIGKPSFQNSVYTYPILNFQKSTIVSFLNGSKFELINISFINSTKLFAISSIIFNNSQITSNHD